ncbi:MAG: BREX system ATP-binding domain-containing protein [Acetobacteraceae bacterium]
MTHAAHMTHAAPTAIGAGMSIEPRMAIEALRAGVPNSAAVRLMGTEQTGIEHAFDGALAAAWTEGVQARPGIGMAGGFGTGKSHLLGYLAEVARQQHFVVSRVVVSKETPLSHPGHLLAAALRDASLPDRPDDPIAACIAVLRERPEAMEAIEVAIGEQGTGLAPIFAASLFLLRRGSTPPEVVRRIARLWSGTKVSLPAFRQALGAAGAGRMFALKSVPAAAMAEQVTRFVPLLFRAAGYAGWCILLDEVELIGRYTPLQRALSYVGLGSLLGLDAAHRFPGIVTVYAITDDFVAAVINARQDAEKLPERLTLKGRPAAASLALSTIRHIERTVLQNRLLPPSAADLAACHDRVRQLYGEAHGWPAPPLPPVERTSSRTLRQYIKGWITQWDLLRLGGGGVTLIAGSIGSNYAEDATLAEPSAPDEDEA